jgi:hypothetical protein
MDVVFSTSRPTSVTATNPRVPMKCPRVRRGHCSQTMLIYLAALLFMVALRLLFWYCAGSRIPVV